MEKKYLKYKDNKYRDNEVWCLAAGRGAGKTTFVKGDPENKLPGKIFESYFKKSKPHNSIHKALIVDTFDSGIWRDFPEFPLTPEHVKTWENGIFRLFSSNHKWVKRIVNKYMFNTLIVFEDATKIIGNRLTEDMRNLIIDSKQKNNDIILLFHAVSAIPLDLGRLPFDKLVLFKTGEKYKKIEGRLLDPQEKLKPAYERIHKAKDKHYYEIIDIRSN